MKKVITISILILFFVTMVMAFSKSEDKHMIVETEKSLELEEWMVNDSIWRVDYFKKEKEPELQIEKWMIDDKIWE